MTAVTKVIWVLPETKDRLYSLGKCRETADKILTRLMNENAELKAKIDKLENE